MWSFVLTSDRLARVLVLPRKFVLQGATTLPVLLLPPCIISGRSLALARAYWSGKLRPHESAILWRL